MTVKRWSDLRSDQQAAVLILGGVQLLSAVVAWTDLAFRRPELVNGSKAKWAAIIAVNFLGPILYFTRGRTAR